MERGQAGVFGCICEQRHGGGGDTLGARAGCWVRGYCADQTMRLCSGDDADSHGVHAPLAAS